MTKRKGGIGRHYGRKRSSNKKVAITKYKCKSLQQDIAAHQAEKDKIILQGKKDLVPIDKRIEKLQTENEFLKMHVSNIMKEKRSNDVKVASLLKKGAENNADLKNKINIIKIKNKAQIENERASCKDKLNEQNFKLSSILLQYKKQKQAEVEAIKEKQKLIVEEKNRSMLKL